MRCRRRPARPFVSIWVTAGRTSCPKLHGIGEIFDRVLHEGGTGMVNNNVQTTLIPAGGSTVVEFKPEVPGTFIMVDHPIFRVFNKGALAMINVEGPADTVIYSGTQADERTGAAPVQAPAASKVERVARGGRVRAGTCAACHQADGQVVAMAFSRRLRVWAA